MGGGLYIICILYTLLKVVSRDDLSVLSVSVTGLQKKQSFVRGVGGWGELYSFLDCF